MFPDHKRIKYKSVNRKVSGKIPQYFEVRQHISK